jgi:hypothetical protein
MMESEPAWAAALRAEVLASVKDLSSSTAHSFTGITKVWMILDFMPRTII